MDVSINRNSSKYIKINTISKEISFFKHNRNKTLQNNALLTMDPNVSGVFNGPYPFGIDPVSENP